MRAIITLTVLVPALVLAACSGDSPTAPRADARAVSVARAGASPAARQITGRCELRTLATDPYPAPPVFRQTVTGSCMFSHLGRATVHFIQVVNFATRTQHSLELTYTMADGDVLRAASAGTSTPIPSGVAFYATINFIGGTGRFANATGQAQADGTASLVNGTSQYSLDGWIAYGAAGRGGDRGEEQFAGDR
jgi:hypothetical protein